MILVLLVLPVRHHRTCNTAPGLSTYPGKGANVDLWCPLGLEGVGQTGIGETQPL
jgi:hypothetical protein